MRLESLGLARAARPRAEDRPPWKKLGLAGILVVSGVSSSLTGAPSGSAHLVASSPCAGTSHATGTVRCHFDQCSSEAISRASSVSAPFASISHKSPGMGRADREAEARAAANQDTERWVSTASPSPVVLPSYFPSIQRTETSQTPWLDVPSLTCVMVAGVLSPRGPPISSPIRRNGRESYEDFNFRRWNYA
jgi:hypothetical protein